MLSSASTTLSWPSAAAGGAGDDGGRETVVDDRRDAAAVGDVGLCAASRRQRPGSGSSPGPACRARPRGRAPAPSPERNPRSGWRSAASPARIAPNTIETPQRASIRRSKRAGTSTTTRPSACTRSVVRCARAVWPPGPLSRTSTMSVAAVNGPDRTPTRPTGHLRGAVQSKDRRNVLQGAGRDHLRRTVRRVFLGRLEQQPNRSGQLTTAGQLRQRETGAEQDGRVDVVPARMADALHGRSVRHILRVLQRQRVEVGPQRDDRAGRAVAGHVADDAVARRQQAWRQAGRGQLPEDELGSLELPPGQLRVSVQMTPYGDELGAPGRQPSVELTGQRVGTGRRLGPPRTHIITLRHRQRTGHGFFLISFGRKQRRQPSPALVTLRNAFPVRTTLRSVTVFGFSQVTVISAGNIVTPRIVDRRREAFASYNGSPRSGDTTGPAKWPVAPQCPVIAVLTLHRE